MDQTSETSVSPDGGSDREFRFGEGYIGQLIYPLLPDRTRDSGGKLQ